MTTPLTALERDLLACVERLVTACETSAAELSGLPCYGLAREVIPRKFRPRQHYSVGRLPDCPRRGSAWHLLGFQASCSQ